MTRIFALLFFLSAITFHSHAQPALGYYLPENISYNPQIPTPKSIVGHEIGAWHLSHDKLIQYLKALDESSDRISMNVTGASHEMRPLINLIITSPQNHQNLEDLRQQHVALTDTKLSTNLDTRKMPAVFYMGFSVHGDEASGTNAAALTAYYLAAAQGKEIDSQLQNVIIILDPCLNPDGMQRFSSWVNVRKSITPSADPNDIEHREAWPGGRFNHYWFDLNRDWLVAQHPESQARVKVFHLWKPNVLTDHHEMGTNATFFFQPGVPSRNHPLTPSKNYELTKRMASFHARALDDIGSLYYTQEDFDDFYYGKGSTFPDVQGAVGILFEQGSARGHAQESVNGIVRFEFAIRNQFVTSLSSLRAVHNLREELLNYQRQFYKDATSEALKDPIKAIVFGANDDKVRALHFAEILHRQQIDVYPLTASQSINGKNFTNESSYVVPLQQAQYKLIKSMFEKRTSFQDSIFYDISGWTLPLAFGLDYEELKTVPQHNNKTPTFSIPAGKRIGDKTDYAYAIETKGFYTPRSLFKLLAHGVRVKISTAPFNHETGKKFSNGTILIPLDNQDRVNANQIEYLLDDIATQDGVDVYACRSGLDLEGTSLGSNSFQALRKPEIALIVGEGVTATDAGEIWHLLDTRYRIPVTLLSTDVLNRANLSRYNTIILPSYSGTSINEIGREKLKAWVQNGGVLIGFENAVSWINNNGLGRFEMKKDEVVAEKKNDVLLRPYASIARYTDAQATSGAIFEAQADLTHPLLYGYDHLTISVFKSNNIFMEKSKNPYANPLVLTGAPLQSGYISKTNYPKVKDTAVVGVTGIGQGQVIGFTNNVCFRAFWFGTHKLLTNAIFYGPIISSKSSR
ncbi:zinc carboxypeptidase [Pseudochryseolinea flava]|uniref:Zinc carboxypeptidase n=2 Tax=Pseudochryseolinea flava TaxID=2059302 RepID=A0A364Y8S2_9BACT|nr:zinc carboxypeptidase [Pseudochryseolinea flava]